MRPFCYAPDGGPLPALLPVIAAPAPVGSVGGRTDGTTPLRAAPAGTTLLRGLVLRIEDAVVGPALDAPGRAIRSPDVEGEAADPLDL